MNPPHRKENVMTYEEYLTRALTRRELNPHERLGQVYFNVLDTVRPDLGDQVRATPNDPFYRDEIVPAFLNWARMNW